ncbi:MAG: hypothetical protein QF773_01830 [Lentisphaeria bacterium]|nr:hypothetical protein [Lentisphaeria bacterium]
MRTVLPAGLGLVFAVISHAADYDVHIVTPAVTDHMILRDAPLPPVCRPGDTLSIAACRGEYEPAAFVVSAPRALKDVRIEVDRLSGPGGTWPAAAVDVRVVKEMFCWTLAQGEGHLAVDVPILLVHDENFLVMEPIPNDKYGWKKPVAKGPFHDADTLQPVQIDGHRQFWITVHVPDNITAGTYTARLQILPANANASELTLEVEVHPFELLASMLEYSIYYPVTLVPEGSPDWRSGAWRNTAHLTPRQYLAECRNMVAHGLTNPNIYNGPVFGEDGSLSVEHMDQILELRERAGMRRKVLYLAGSQILIADRPLTDEECKKNQRYVRQTNEWARARGYEVYHMTFDEWKGDKLTAARNSMQCIRDAGGKMFAAVNGAAFFERVGDLLDLPILHAGTRERLSSLASSEFDEKSSLRNMPTIAKAGRLELIRDPERCKAIDGVHARGGRIFTYMNPMAGQFLPGLQRRNRGLGLWRSGFDGTMNWSYSHIASDPFVQRMLYGAVYRTDGGVLDTLHWEGSREGVDDVRYLTTLLAVLGDCAGRFPDEPLVPETYDWLRNVDLENGDLDGIRLEMARRIVALMKLRTE